ncbi:hypothetical protein TL16_g06332 [Triparma laevis f. inornata]|uniref:Uncharacterized protein n=1 Tax=Triparma laevis f. inornata TaxID=1714386 RepID=A0A9W7AKJ1_9STRA|nr:hypothetical protein TL16_g06332 [Triparma laevis f. inornata]
MEMCEGDSEDEDGLMFPLIEQYCGRATFIEEQTMKLYLCTDPDDSEITAQMVFDKLDHNLMEASVEPDCVNLWQWFIDYVGEEEEWAALPEAERLATVHPQKKLRMEYCTEDGKEYDSDTGYYQP